MGGEGGRIRPSRPSACGALGGRGDGDGDARAHHPLLRAGFPSRAHARPPARPLAGWSPWEAKRAPSEPSERGGSAPPPAPDIHPLRCRPSAADPMARSHARRARQSGCVGTRVRVCVCPEEPLSLPGEPVRESLFFVPPGEAVRGGALGWVGNLEGVPTGRVLSGPTLDSARLRSPIVPPR